LPDWLQAAPAAQSVAIIGVWDAQLPRGHTGLPARVTVLWSVAVIAEAATRWLIASPR
jgi:hypothetical protein